MLIIMHDRDVHCFFQLLFNIKTFRSFNIFKIDAAKSGFQCFDDLQQIFPDLFH